MSHRSWNKTQKKVLIKGKKKSKSIHDHSNCIVDNDPKLCGSRSTFQIVSRGCIPLAKIRVPLFIFLWRIQIALFSNNRTEMISLRANHQKAGIQSSQLLVTSNVQVNLAQRWAEWFTDLGICWTKKELKLWTSSPTSIRLCIYSMPPRG
jgi:hypothetical protein